MYLVIILFIIIFFYVNIFSEPFTNGIKYYDYGPALKNKIKKTKEIKSICFIAGVHGNEPAASIELISLIKNNYFNHFKNNGLSIRVIPCVNVWGLKNNTRYQPNMLYPDINRNFSENGLEASSIEIIRLTKNFDIVIDFHEGWGFHLINSKSIGSTISPSNNFPIELSSLITENINKNINDLSKKFIILKNYSCSISKTLACHREKNNKHYLLVETTGQNNIQKLSLRRHQIFTVINETLNYISKKK